METDDDSKIKPVRKTAKKNGGNGDIYEGCVTYTQCDKLTNCARNASILQQSMKIYKRWKRLPMIAYGCAKHKERLRKPMEIEPGRKVKKLERS